MCLRYEIKGKIVIYGIKEGLVTMKKIILYSIVGLLATYFMSNKRIRRLTKSNIERESEFFPIEEAGVPETDNPENANMVDEGSQFGVNYYNNLKEE